MVLLLAFLTGCAGAAPGRIFTKVVRPYSIDFNRTPFGAKHCVINEHSIKEPISGRGITVEWSSGDIYAAAQKAGIQQIHYTEEQTLSILFGLYKRRQLIVCGD